VVPSLYEGFSLPAIEAMACALPVVATTGGALPEVVGDDGTTAYLVPPGDAEALAARIGAALDDPAGRARVGAAGRRRVVERWSWRHTAEQTVEQYRAVLAAHPDSRC
jgi:glycosyltransferase involved in cell wall biosynthesis